MPYAEFQSSLVLLVDLCIVIFDKMLDRAPAYSMLIKVVASPSTQQYKII